MTVKVFDDLESLSRAAADEFVRLSGEHHPFNVALSGGSTPKKMLELLAGPDYQGKVDWSNLHVYWSDERYVPYTDPASNEGMARKALLDSVPIPAGQIHGMYREGGASEAAETYEKIIPARFDLMLLGLGPDGHTASLFPGDPSVHETERKVVASKGAAGVPERITMTPDYLAASKEVLFLAAGPDKTEPLWRAIEGPLHIDQTPSQTVARRAKNAIWYVDKVAASKLGSVTPASGTL